jgi:hypothetical protein
VVLAASSALAGDMPQGFTSPSPSSGASVTGDLPCGVTSTSPSSQASVTGEMPFGVTSAIDPLTDFTLSLLQNLLSIF